MAMRYFRGQAPSTSFTDHSDEDDGSPPPSNQPQPAANPQSRRRPRISARVVTPVQPSPNSTHPRTRPTTSTFVPISATPLHPNQPFRPAQLKINTTSSSSSSSSSSYSHDYPKHEQANTSHYENEHTSPATASQPAHPVFIPQDLTVTKNEEQIEAQRAEQRHNERIHKRHEEAKHLVTLVLNEENNRRDGHAPNDILPDDDDNPEFHEADHSLWKLREILRIKRDKDEKIAWESRTSAPRHDDSANESSDDEKDEPNSLTSPNFARNVKLLEQRPKKSFMQRFYKVEPSFSNKFSDRRDDIRGYQETPTRDGNDREVDDQ